MTISRVNLCLRPSLKGPGVGAPNWFITGGANNWGRTTSADASLPRSTAAAGTTPGVTVHSAAAPVVPGRTYVGSVHMRSISANTVTCLLTWFAEDGIEIVGQGTATGYTQGANTTVRATALAAVAPGDAACVRVSIVGLDGSAQLTGALIEQASTVGTYFDGDTPGARWTSTDGASPSAIGASDLAATVDYDDERGRVRTFAQLAASPAGRVRVSRRGANRAALEEVRGGGSVPVLAGAAVRSADDYEHPDAEGGLVYRVETFSGAVPLRTDLNVLGQTPEPAIETVDVAFAPPVIRAWLKFVAAPRFNRKITITGWGPIERPDRNQLYDVDGRTDPIVVTSGHSSRRTTLTLRTWTRDETDALDESLRQGIPGFLHLPDSLQLPSMYLVFGGYRHRPASRRSEGAVWEIPVVEVAAPPASIFATGNTWQTVLDTYPTWQALLDANTEWRRVTS